MLHTLKTTFLLALLSALILGLGALLGGTQGLHIAFIMACCMNLILYFFSESIVLTLYNAQPLKPDAHVYPLVKELAYTMNLPMPRLWLIKNSMANAFATGRSPAHSSIVLTSGILEILDHDELRGVLAHELSHIKNRDVFVNTLATILATTISYMTQMTRYQMMWGSSRSRDKNNAHPFLIFLALLLMPFIALLIRLGISRTREYLADQTGAHYSREPLALAHALEKLHRTTQYHTGPQTVPFTAPFIVNPLRSGTVASWFSTHPPIQERIERLKAMAYKL